MIKKKNGNVSVSAVRNSNFVVTKSARVVPKSLVTRGRLCVDASGVVLSRRDMGGWR